MESYPWKEPSEFFTMYDRLFPLKIRSQINPDFKILKPLIGEISDSMKILQIWCKRTDDSQLIATYTCLKKVIQYLKLGDEPDQDLLRDSLSIGLVRIVNAVTDSKQTRGPTDK